MKLAAIALVFAGEALSIAAEMFGARLQGHQSETFLVVFVKMFGLITFAGGLLILGYMVGLRAFQNIWIVSAISITSILIIEPLLAYTVFHHAPTLGALIGLVLGALGFAAAILL